MVWFLKIFSFCNSVIFSIHFHLFKNFIYSLWLFSCSDWHFRFYLMVSVPMSIIYICIFIRSVCTYPTPLPWARCDAKSQFSCGVKLVWIEKFPFSQFSLIFTHSSRENKWVHALSKDKVWHKHPHPTSELGSQIQFLPTCVCVCIYIYIYIYI